MLDLASYQPSDFLMFSPRVYYRLIELHNEAVWPLQLLMVGLGFAILYLLMNRLKTSAWLIPVVLGVIWFCVGWSFLWERYATINWPLIYIAPFFALQAIWLIGIGLLGHSMTIPLRFSPIDILFLALLVFALIGYPLSAPLAGRDWLGAEIFGIAVDPTAVATLAIMALIRGWASGIAMIVPAVWCLISSATLWTMEAGDFFVPLLCAVLTFCLLIIRRFITQDEDS